MDRKLRFAIAGAGVIGRAHWERMRASGRCEAVAFADPSPGAAVLAAEAGLPLYPDLEAMLAAERPDGVVLATPNALHVPGALACVRSGVPALVEKPVADSLADAARLADAVEASAVPVLVGHHRRHSAILGAACETIAEGRLGKLVAVTASATFHKPDDYFEAAWRRRKGGGPILINLVHEIDNLRALVGDIVEVQAFGSHAARGFEVEDTVAINLRFANGALGSFMLSDAAASPRSWEQTSGENQAYDHHADQDCYVIAGTRGSLQVPTLRVFEYSGAASWWNPLARSRVELHQSDPLARQLDHFCAVVRREEPPRVTVRDAMRTLAVTLAVAEAVRSGTNVKVS
ncbi:Gfo/Idh/MocA family oxidoreductase [Variovorax paradoxus]|nr:Gfo/Idh/MocA family oxidoreductase [Variovorax paradoxus]